MATDVYSVNKSSVKLKTMQIHESSEGLHEYLVAKQKTVSDINGLRSSRLQNFDPLVEV